MLRVSTGNGIIHMSYRIRIFLVRNSVLSKMSLEQECDAASISLTMLDLKTKSGVGSSGGFDNQSKKLMRQKSGNGIAIEALEIDLPKSLDEKVPVTINARELSNGNKELRIISLNEIAWHDTPDDCWFAVYDYVYDCTSFIKNHPGGDDVLLEYAGRDATLAFIGAGHSKFAKKMLERYLIGELPHSERIFRIDGGVKVFGI